MANRQSHWEDVHRRKRPDEVSWFQSIPEHSLELVERAACPLDQPVLDVGGGVSSLVDHLLARGFSDVTVFDLSEEALLHSQRRLGPAATRVRWLVGDVLSVPLGGPYALWHDRAVFHFLTRPEEQERYIERLRSHVVLGGHIILATFAEDGPEKCSGLSVSRYSPEQLAARLGSDFAPLQLRRATHTTPAGAEQRFVYGLFCRMAS